MKQVRFLLAALLLMVCGIMAHAQKVVVYKHDGTKVEYKSSDVKDVKYKTLPYKLTDKDGNDITALYKCTTTQPSTTNTYATYSSLSNKLTEDTTVCCNKNFEVWWYNNDTSKWENFDTDGASYSSLKSVYYYQVPANIEWFLYIKG